MSTFIPWPEFAYQYLTPERGNAMNWKPENVGDGRYHIRDAGGVRRPGLVIGGRRTWAAELGGQTIGYYPSVMAACAALLQAGEELYRRRTA